MSIKKKNLGKLFFALIKNPKRGHRDLAESLRISQPTVTRLRKTLKAVAIQQYTVIPKPS